MKVALELQPCCGRRSGIGVYTYELAKRLRSENGLEFCGNLFNFAGRNDNTEAIPIRESRMFPYGVYRRIWDIVPVSYDSLFPGKADLTIFFNYIVPPRIKGDVMTAVHDLTYLQFSETMDARNLKRIKQGIRYSVERSSRVLTISEFSKGEIAELLGVPEEKIAVVSPAPSLSGVTADFDGCRQKWGIKELRHRDDVVFTGYVSDGEKNALYQNAEVFVFPSLYEGFGIPPLEAMAHGCPVVCANAASLPEVAGGAAELVDPLEVEGIAAGIWRVLSDGAYARHLRENGRIQAKKYTWESSAERLMSLCRELGR